METELRTELLFTLEADVEERQDIGETAFGRRRVYMVSGGRFVGPMLRGELLPGAGDWLVRGSDGTSELDVRATLRTDDGHLIYNYYRGIYHVSPEVKARMDQGEEVSPSEYYFRTTPRFETGSEKYAWLNRTIAVGVGRKTTGGIAYHVYRVL
ncbi:DUF3237 domain-containing protein [Streptomyces chromofuscus]|uniref:DUF3237 domain-containing protein n=1 Tax=Streptomyces chromofuscus TaxID=42881 RepID=UPI001675A8B7|nr:DUF3237 domain-containing protein [Streptomyces chromofuscus]GGT43202.1 hypothetical protein GCM10010254_73180 [Streptomyces chromofuscus]